MPNACLAYRLLAVSMLSVGWMFIALHLRSPYLCAFRNSAPWLWLGAGGGAVYFLLGRPQSSFRRQPARTILSCALVVDAAAVFDLPAGSR